MRRVRCTSAAGMPSGGRHCRSTSCSSRTSRPSGSCSKFFLRSAGGDTHVVSTYWRLHSDSSDTLFILALAVTLSLTHTHTHTVQSSKKPLSVCRGFFSLQTLMQTVNHTTQRITMGYNDGVLQKIHLHIHLSWHIRQAKSWKHLPFCSLSSLLPLFRSVSHTQRHGLGTDMRCERRRGCSWWCRLSSRPHTGTSSPPVQTAPPPES